MLGPEKCFQTDVQTKDERHPPNPSALYLCTDLTSSRLVDGDAGIILSGRLENISYKMFFFGSRGHF
jgi:hypothetical protein